jgi:polar amino acid transport system substrate-binding protein
MKKHAGTFLLALLWTALPGTAAAEDAVLRVRADSWMPFNGEPAEARPGYVIELARLIFEPAGIKLDYQVMPWKDALAAAHEGAIEAVVGANSIEAKGLVVPKNSAGMTQIGLFVKKGNPWQYQNIPTLGAVRVGVIESYSYWDTFDTYIKKNPTGKVVVFNGNTPLLDGIDQLKKGKIDVMAETFSVFIWTVISNGGSPGDYRLAFLESGDPIYMAFANNETGTRYAAIFDEGIVRLRKSGQLATILKKYAISDWK